MFATQTHGATTTHSPIKAWFLANFRGQRIVTRWQTPLFSVAFITVYSVRWELLPANAL